MEASNVRRVGKAKHWWRCNSGGWRFEGPLSFYHSCCLLTPAQGVVDGAERGGGECLGFVRLGDEREIGERVTSLMSTLCVQGVEVGQFRCFRCNAVQRNLGDYLNHLDSDHVAQTVEC